MTVPPVPRNPQAGTLFGWILTRPRPLLWGVAAALLALGMTLFLWPSQTVLVRTVRIQAAQHFRAASQALSPGRRLPAQRSLSTAKNGWAMLELQDRSALWIFPDSQIRWQQAQSVLLIRGKIWLRQGSAQPLVWQCDQRFVSCNKTALCDFSLRRSKGFCQVKLWRGSLRIDDINAQVETRLRDRQQLSWRGGHPLPRPVQLAKPEDPKPWQARLHRARASLSRQAEDLMR